MAGGYPSPSRAKRRWRAFGGSCAGNDGAVQTLPRPEPRGPLSGFVLGGLKREPGDLGKAPTPSAHDPLSDDDLHLSLYLCYELHYRSVAGADERWEWDPSLLAFRLGLEAVFETAVAEEVAIEADPEPGGIADLIVEASREEGGPSISGFLAREATLEQFREFVVHRSAYHLKEADPHSFAIPRLEGKAKSALVEVQADEYGAGRPERMHSTLFAKTMRGLGLDDGYGAYLDIVPGSTLATVNLLSLFALHRRSRGALAGHLAYFELTSSIPNRRYGDGLRRLGLDEDATDFFDEHVEADAVHDMIATYDLAGTLAADEPHLARDVLFGALALAEMERRFAEGLLDTWSRDESSLLAPIAEVKERVEA